MSTPDPPQLEPVRNDGIRAIQVGLGLWAVAGLFLLVRRDELADQGTQWWLAVCGAGLLIGDRAAGHLRQAPVADPCTGARRGPRPPTSGPTGAGPTG